MYFPFLYGRGAELLAIRSLLRDPRDRSALVPIVEPVNANIAPLRRCLDACEEVGQPVVVVVNPGRHQLADPGEARRWFLEAVEGMEACPSAYPAFRTNDRTSLAAVTAVLNAFPEREVVLIHGGAGLGDQELRQLARNPRVAWHIVLDGTCPARQQDLLPGGKKVIVRDHFRKLDRNADYAGTEFFTDQHRTFPPHAGFGDYLCLGSEFKSGGSTPGAVAIHGVFKNPLNGDVWVEHFVSDDRDRNDGDVASKFLQAAAHFVRAARRRPREFGANPALSAYASYVRQSQYPGLSKNKEHQIVHHICVVLDLLSGTL